MPGAHVIQRFYSNAITFHFIGNAEWEDSERTSLRIIWKTPEAFAGEVYSWAVRNDLINTVFTVYELHSGEEYQDSGANLSQSSSCMLYSVF